MKKLVFLFFSMFAFLLTQGQVTTSSFSGKVTDAAGAPMAGVAVIAKHTSSGTDYGTVTDAKGNFRIQNVRPGGPYTVVFRMLGYKTFEKKDIQVPLGDNYVISPKLNEESTNIDAVVVASGTNSIMNSDRSGTATNINSRQLATLPSISRSIEDFTRLTPQANGNSFAGRDSRYNNITIDGAGFNNRFGLSSNNLPGGNAQPISLDAIQEVTVNLSPFDIRESNFTGASINAVTKSGDNNYTGSVYTFFRPKSFTGDKVQDLIVANAKTKSTKTIGMRVGGPIVKDKLFFFFSGELDKQTEPGISWRPSQGNESQVTPTSSYISRTTTYDLERVKNHVMNTFGYDPGSYTDFPNFASQNYKIMGRLDWNINSKNKLTVRYNDVQSTNDVMVNGKSGPKSFSSNRYSTNGFAFSNANYGFIDKVKSITGEWNSQFSSNVSNKLLVSMTNIRTTRTSPSDIFPFVDILDGTEKSDIYMSLGYELFSYLNDVKNNTLSITDNVSVSLGNHNLTAGASFERQYFYNSFFGEGTGYYCYNSVEDFLKVGTPQETKPIAFGLTYPFQGDEPSGVELTFGTVSAYVQDEWTLSQKFKLTGGIRFEMPIYFTDLQSGTKIKNGNDLVEVSEMKFVNDRTMNLGEWPKNSLLVSPRIGFNWDVLGDRKLQIRGGTGLFTGLLPFVWFTNQPGSAGFIQAPEVKLSKPGDVPNDMRFQKDFHKQLELFPNQLPSTTRGVIGKSSVLAQVDRDFKLPQIWRSSLAADIEMPWQTVLTLEAIYSKDVNAVVPQDINLKEPGNLHFNGPDQRPLWWAENAQGKWVSDNRVSDLVNNAMVLTNTHKGYQLSLTAMLTKRFTKGFSGMVAYTYNVAKDVSANPGSRANSVWQNNVTATNMNDPELSYSQFAVPHRVNGFLSYSVRYANHLATTISLYYNGMSSGRISYIYNGDYNGDYNRANDLIYVPRDPSEIKFVDYTYTENEQTKTYKAEDQSKDFFEFINGDKYLSSRKGQAVERAGALKPWVNRFDIKIAQDVFTNFGTDKRYTLQFTADILNVGNLLCKDWGVYYTSGGMNYDNINVLSYIGVDAQKNPTFNVNGKNRDEFLKNVTYKGNATVGSTWGCQLGVRLIF